MRIKYKMLLLLLSVSLLSGCTLIPFEDPEAQKQKALEAATKVEISLPNAKEMQESDRTYRRELKSKSGLVLATYEARMPSFSTTGEHSAVFERINEHYQGEFEACRLDCDSLFEAVKRQYGEEWEVLESVENVVQVTYTYRLLDAPEAYICIEKVYTSVSSGGVSTARHYPDVFLAENGWRLSFDGLFGYNAEQAGQRVLDGIARWCESNQVPCEKLSGLSAQTFTEYYAIDTESLIFHIEPFLLSTNDGKSYVVELPISGYADLFVQ